MIEEFYGPQPAELLKPHEDCEDFCGPPLFPEAWTILRVDITTMTDEQRDALYRGIDLLHEAGLSFDTGMGGGYFDCELDWSLKGASAVVRPFPCYNRDCKNEGYSPAFWTVYTYTQRDGTHAVPYCSVQCRNGGDAERLRPVCIVGHDESQPHVAEAPACTDHEKAAEYSVLMHETVAGAGARQ